MEREPLPIIALQVSIIVLAFLGFNWIFKFFSIDQEFFVILGVIIIITSSIVSQLLFGIWKILGGFSLFDASRQFLHCVPTNKRWVVQTIFDKYWHNSKIGDIVIEYSRRRSAVCELNLFGWVISLIFTIFFIAIVIYLCFTNPYLIWKALILFGFFSITTKIFFIHFKITVKN